MLSSGYPARKGMQQKYQMKLYLEAKVMLKNVLGTVWLSEKDTFTFKIKIELAKETMPLGNPDFIPVKLTKRLILSKLAGIFDPVGAGAAVLIKPKIVMQELWQLGLGWDNALPPEVKRKMRLFKEIMAFNNIQFERCLAPPNKLAFLHWSSFAMPHKECLVHVPTQSGMMASLENDS